MERLLYNEITQSVRSSENILVHENCNSWTAINLGSDVVTVNNIQLLPSSSPGTITGDSVSIGGNVGEVYNKQTIDVVFQTTNGPWVMIIQKVYAKHYI